jgi:hypothetical protein
MDENKSQKRLTKRSALIVLVVLLGLFAVGLMLLHRVPDKYDGPWYGENYQLIGPFWMVLHHDSHHFMYGAEDPSIILTPNYMRQSRPGSVVLAYFISKILGPVLTSIERFLVTTGREFHDPLDHWLHQYVAYIAINFSVVITSFWYYIKHVGTKTTISLASAAAGALLLLNNISKPFLLTPHTVILELLVPLVVLDLYVRVRRADSIQRSGLIAYTIILGLASMAYTGFLIAGPTAAIAEFLNRCKRGKKKIMAKIPWWSLLATVVMLLPISIWMIFIMVRNGSFYAAEFAGGELVWIVDAVNVNPLHTIWLLVTYTWQLTWMALEQTWPLLLVIAGMFLTVGPGKIWRVAKQESQSDFPLGVLIVSILSILFFAIIGHIVPRRSYMAVPSLIVLLGWFVERLSTELEGQQRTRLTFGVVAAVVLSTVIVFAQQGPYW